jgi:hypothetical protein
MSCGAVSQFPPEEPSTDCYGEPGKSGEKEDDPGAGAGKPDTEDECEAGESDATHCGSVGVDGGDSAAAVGAVVTGSGFVLFFMGFDEAGAGGENGGEGQEEAADNRAIVLGDEASGYTDCSAEDEADDPLVWLDSFDCREASPDNHRGYLIASQNAKDTANQIGSSDRVAVKALGLKRQRSQVVEAA